MSQAGSIERRRRQRRTAAAGVLLASMLTVAAAGAGAQGPALADAVLYRLFLQDGGVLVSYGEFARVADRVIVPIPLGGTDTSPVLHLVSIAAADVDWARTDAYAEAARARRYAETRGESDFARLTREVADMLNQVGSMPDPRQRLALAESARRRLVEWPRQHYGFRAEEIGQMATWLDSVVSELRIAAGQSSFDLAFVAAAPAGTPAVTLMPAPDFQERIELGLRAARRTADPAERVSLLRAVLDLLEPVLPEGSWMAAAHARASGELAAELRLDGAYAAVAERALRRAASYEQNADVRGLESVVRSVLEEDAKLNRARPADVAALLAALDAKIDAARRLRLARDAWAVRAALVRGYWQDVRPGLDHLLGVREWLTDIRQLAGPSPRWLRRLAVVAELAERELARVHPPAEVAGAHASLNAAAGLARRAAASRMEAVRTGNLATAWHASSAAAGALMLLDQAVEELRRITKAPRP